MRLFLGSSLLAAILSAAPPAHYFVTTFAGTVPPLANPIAVQQYLDHPAAVAYDPKGNLYYANSYQIWRLNPDGTDTLIAGGGTVNSTVGSDPRKVSFNPISSIVFDSLGNLYITDGRVFEVTPLGVLSQLQANNGTYFRFGAYMLAVDGSDNLYASGYSEGSVKKYQPGTKTFTTVAQLPANDEVAGLSAAANTLYVQHSANFTEVLRFDLGAEGFLGPVPITPAGAGSVTVSPNGSIFAVFGRQILQGSAGVGFQVIAGTGVSGYSGDGGPARLADIAPSADAFAPSILAVNPVNGDLAVNESINHVIRVIAANTHIIQTVAGQRHFGGDNGPAILALLDADSSISNSGGIASDRSGNLYVSDANNARIRKISSSGTITTVAGTGTQGSSGDGGKATQANIDGFGGNLAFDQSGNLYFVNRGDSDTIRMVDLNGNIHTIAGGGSSPIGGIVQATDVKLGSVTAITLDPAGNLYLAQTALSKSQIFRVDTSGNISLYAGTLSGGFGYTGDGTPAIRAYLGSVNSIATDSKGRLYFADDSENLIRMIDSQENLATVAGANTGILYSDPLSAGAATNSRLDFPASLVFDAADNLYFVHHALYGPQIIMVDTVGNLTPIAGNPPASTANATIPAEFTSGDGGDSLKAGFTTAVGMTLDSAGNIYVLDFGIYVRKLAPYDPNNPPPFLSPGGVVGAGASFPAVAAVSPNGDATLYGANFGVNHTLGAADLVNGKVPTNMAGVCVNFGGVPAAMLGVYPNQINVQVPSLPPGPIVVQVTMNCGTSKAISSNLVGVTLQTASPEFFSFLPDAVAGNNPIAAVNALTNVLIGSPGLLTGVAFTPAKAGDIVAAYGTGWGPTSPPIAVGVIPGGAANLASPYSVTLGGVVLPASNILYAGASPCCSGLYQVNFTIPSGIQSGNQPLVLTVGGVSSPPHAFITMQ